MFIDRARIFVKAGDGGNGCVSFRKEKRVPRGGPDGGDGGHGGSVILETSSQLVTLVDFRYRPHWKAQRGGHGQSKDKHGRNGRESLLKVPCGTVVMEKDGALIADLRFPNDRCVVAKGGQGGRGNAFFAGPSRQTPRTATKGQPGEEKSVRLELKLVADVGLVGKPNAGKSSLLAAISRAHPKIGHYPFTTIEPNLGAVMGPNEMPFIVADMPGLIEGASQGHGLGIDFLRHIERTRVLAFVVDVTASDPLEDLEVVRSEMEQYRAELSTRPSMVLLNKIDLVDAGKINLREISDRVRQANSKVFPISALEKLGFEPVVEAMDEIVTAERAREYQNTDPP